KGEKEAFTFIKRDELYQQPNRMDPEEGSRGATFKGEDALTSALIFLQQGKTEPVVYFTQGEGELNLFGALERAKPARTAQSMRDRLEQAHYKVKGLRLEANAAKQDDGRVVVAEAVPDDAAVVVVAGPRQEFTPKAADALRKYMTVPRKEKDRTDPEG